MYRTDKQFMTNPVTASSRIYIGFVPKTVVAADLEEKFKCYGKILGLVLQMGFAFIQYENDAQAQAAIKSENGSMLHGRKICVKQALDKSQKGGNSNNNNQFMNKKSAPASQTQMDIPNLTQFNKPLIEHLETENVNITDSVQLLTAPPPPSTKLLFNPIHNDTIGSDGPPEKRSRKRRMHGKDDCFQHSKETYRDMPFYGHDDNCPPPTYNPPNLIVDQPDRNDCEIIVVSKSLTKYAEYIEQRLKTLGLIVDLLFPNEDVPIGRVLANISSRGCLYAILVMPQNEEHRSLTLNILHGIPQEHRNMPIEDALILITRNFDAYMHGDKMSGDNQGSNSISDRHPSSVQMVLNLLAENRQITSTHYDKLLIYLQQRRELQHHHEVAEGIEQNSEESNNKQAELQSRIMNILNKTSNENTPVEVTTQMSTGSVAPPLLKDPSVQKALDSLLSGEMFKNIGSVH